MIILFTLIGVALGGVWLLSLTRLLHVHLNVTKGHILSVSAYDGLLYVDHPH
jgi:hypothetical protein